MLNISFYVTVTCAALPAGSNTECIGDNLAGSAVGTNYTYECLDGYLPPANGLVTTCLPSGKWSLQTPECEESKYILSIVLFFLFLLVFKYTCVSFNQKLIYFTVTCKSLPEGQNTKSPVDDLAGSVVGTNYTYECLEGYYQASSDGLLTECLPSGEWSLSAPTCEQSR